MNLTTVKRTVLALAMASIAAPALACGSTNPCTIRNGHPLEDIATFWRIVRASPDPTSAVDRVEAKFGAMPIDFLGYDPKNRGRDVHVVIVSMKTDGVLYYAQAPVVNVDVSILLPSFSGPSRHLVPIVIGGN